MTCELDVTRTVVSSVPVREVDEEDDAKGAADDEDDEDEAVEDEDTEDLMEELNEVVKPSRAEAKHKKKKMKFMVAFKLCFVWDIYISLFSSCFSLDFVVVAKHTLDTRNFAEASAMLVILNLRGKILDAYSQLCQLFL